MLVLTRRGLRIPLFLSGGGFMTILIGSARSDEHGKYSGGQRGDQRQTSSPDYAGEVSVQAFYMHSKGWYILRPKEASVAVGIAAAMQAACNNKNIGYSQSDRYAILKVGTGTKTPTSVQDGDPVYSQHRALHRRCPGYKDQGAYCCGRAGQSAQHPVRMGERWD